MFLFARFCGGNWAPEWSYIFICELNGRASTWWPRNGQRLGPGIWIVAGAPLNIRVFRGVLGLHPFIPQVHAGALLPVGETDNKQQIHISCYLETILWRKISHVRGIGSLWRGVPAKMIGCFYSLCRLFPWERNEPRYGDPGEQPGGRTSKDKSPEAGRSLASLRNSKESSVAGEEERGMGRGQEVWAEKEEG